MKKTLEDFEKLLCNDKLLCTKEIVNMNFKTIFATNTIYEPATIFITKDGKYDQRDRSVKIEIKSGQLKATLHERGLNAENELYKTLKQCFTPLNEVISIFLENR